MPCLAWQEACDAHARLVLLCHPVELLPPQCGMIPVVIPSPLPLYKVRTGQGRVCTQAANLDGVGEQCAPDVYLGGLCVVNCVSNGSLTHEDCRAAEHTQVL